jgi:Kef-type K+ transport system membrane component KefB
MVELCSKCLFFNGAVMLLSGLLSGVPMGLAIIQKKGRETVRAWRVAHSTLIMDGLMVIIVGLVVPSLSLGGLASGILVWALVISAYGFVLALTIGAWKGYRGLTPEPYGINAILYGGHIIGALGSLAGVAMLIYGLFRAF